MADPSTWGFVPSLVNIGLVFFMLANLGGLLTWVERKQGAVMANRIGANRAYLFFQGFTLLGLFHAIADGLKMIVKEDFRPPWVDRFTYNLAPWFAVVPVFVVFAVIPFGGTIQPGHIFDGPVMTSLAESVGALGALNEFLRSTYGDQGFGLIIANLDVGLLFVFAIGSTGVFAAVLAGWSSNNKFSILGALRASSQMISYEVFVGLSVMGIVLLHGTVSLKDIVHAQGESIWMWGAVAQFPMLWIFLAGNMAENKRVPFDMPEAESELVAGYMTEYSAMKMGLFMMSEFIEIAVVSALVTVLFLGGHHLPGLSVTTVDGVAVGSLAGLQLSHLATVVIGIVVFWTKVVLLCCFQILIRWTVPRFRYDQVLHLGWKIMLPLCIVNLIVTASLVTLQVPEWWVGVGSLASFVIAVVIGSRISTRHRGVAVPAAGGAGLGRPLTLNPRMPQPAYADGAGAFSNGEIVTYYNAEPETLSPVIRSYLLPVFHGLLITGRRFAKHMAAWLFWLTYFVRGKKSSAAALAVRAKASSTTFYPEYERPDLTRVNRGKHVLTVRPSGEPQCVACYMCSMACPAQCMHIEAGQHPDPKIEKYPTRFDIEIDKCIFCGLCEEACPVDAIRLTTDYHTTDYFRERMIYDRDFLLTWNPTTVTREHIYPGGAKRRRD